MIIQVATRWWDSIRQKRGVTSVVGAGGEGESQRRGKVPPHGRPCRPRTKPGFSRPQGFSRTRPFVFRE